MYIHSERAWHTCLDMCHRWKYGVLSFKGVAELSNKEWFEQLPFIVAISVMAGVMGALFNIAHKRMFRVCTPCSPSETFLRPPSWQHVLAVVYALSLLAVGNMQPKWICSKKRRHGKVA